MKTLTQQQIEKVEEKMAYAQEKRMVIGSDKADEIHHKECKLECCGEHDIDAENNETGKCTKCGMNEDQINDHNMMWWGIVDYLEATDLVVSLYSKIEYTLKEFLENLEGHK